MSRRRIPSYRRYKPKDLGLVVIDGRQHYLGKYGTPESIAEYHRLIQEWMTRGSASRISAAPSPESGPETENLPATALINDIIADFMEFAEGHYVGPDGTPSGEIVNLREAVKPLRSLYGYTPADKFGPLGLRAVRDKMIDQGLSRTTINSRINRIRRVFRWAASVELVPGAVVQSLGTVAGLQKGRTKARESRGIRPVPVQFVEATLPHMNPLVRAMVQLQLLTGCRAGEVMVMRGCELTPGDPNLVYRPRLHKNSWRGQERVIYLGPRAQAILRDFLKDDPSEFIFSPRDAVAAHQAMRRQNRALQAHTFGVESPGPGTRAVPCSPIRPAELSPGRRHGLRPGLSPSFPVRDPSPATDSG